MRVLVRLLIFIGIANSAIAQGQLVNIDVGQRVPDIKMENIVDASFTSGSLQELSSDKILILDFWATWCAPCLHAFPGLDSLVNEFDGAMQVIAVTSQRKEVVQNVFKNRAKNNLYVSKAPKVMGDSTLNKLFPHRIIPHYVWIRNGEVIAITEEVNREQVIIALQGKYPTLAKKVDRATVHYSRYKTPFIEFLNNVSKDKLASRVDTYSILTGFVPELGYSGGYSSVRDYLLENNRRITATNLNLESLYRVAYGRMKTFISDGVVDLLSKDSMLVRNNVSGLAAMPLIEKRAYCYEIVASEDVVFEKMQADLDLEFPRFKAEIIEAVDTCFVLEKINDNIEKYVVASDSTPVNDYSGDCMHKESTLMSGLRTTLEGFVFRYSKYPVVDHTGFEKRFNISMCGNLGNLQKLNKVLQPYGLQVVKKKVRHERLVIRDR